MTRRRYPDPLKVAYEHLDIVLAPVQDPGGASHLHGMRVKTADASWEDVVSFLKNNSMFLSHGYCQDCEKNFPE